MPMVKAVGFTFDIKTVIKTLTAVSCLATILAGCANMIPKTQKPAVYHDPLGSYHLYMAPLPISTPYDIRYRCDIYGSYSKFNSGGVSQLKVDAINVLGNDSYKNNTAALLDKTLTNYVNLNHVNGKVTYRINMINRLGNTLFAEVTDGTTAQIPRRTGYLLTRNNDIVYVLQAPSRSPDISSIKSYLSQVLAFMRIPNPPVVSSSQKLPPSETIAFINPSTATAQNVKDWLNKYGCR